MHALTGNAFGIRDDSPLRCKREQVRHGVKSTGKVARRSLNRLVAPNESVAASFGAASAYRKHCSIGRHKCVQCHFQRGDNRAVDDFGVENAAVA